MRFLLFIVSLLVVIYYATALSCYSTGSLNLNYKPQGSDSKDCSSLLTTTQAMCYKATTNKKDGNGNTIKSVSFGCSNDNFGSKAANAKDICTGIKSGTCQSSGGVTYCCCSGTNCNPAAERMGLIPVIVAAFYVIYRCQ